MYATPGQQGGPWELLSAGLLSLLPGDLDLLVLRVVAPTVLVLVVLAALPALRRRLGLSDQPLVVLGVAAAVVVWLVPAYAFDGHAAELVIPMLWLLAGLQVLGQRSLAAAVLVGLASGWELWGGLGVAILLLARRPRRRHVLDAAASAGVVALTYLPFVVSGSFALFRGHWPISPASLVGVLGGSGSFTWAMRLGQGAACLLAGAAFALLLRGSHHGVWLVPLIVAEMRVLLDPQTYDYYLVTPQLLLLAGVALLDRDRATTLATVAALAFLQVSVFQPTRVATEVVTVAACAGLAVALGRGPHRAARRGSGLSCS